MLFSLYWKGYQKKETKTQLIEERKQNATVFFWLVRNDFDHIEVKTTLHIVQDKKQNQMKAIGSDIFISVITLQESSET